MASSVPNKIVLKSTTKMSLHDRFSQIKRPVIQQNVRVQMAGTAEASARNRRLAQQMANRPNVQAALKLKKKSLQQRLGSNVRNRLNMRGRGGNQFVRGNQSRGNQSRGNQYRGRGRGQVFRGRGRGQGNQFSSPRQTNQNFGGTGGFRGRGMSRGGRGRGGVFRGGRGGLGRGAYSKINRGTPRGRPARGRGARGRGRGRGRGGNVSRDDLDNQLDAYMSNKKEHLDSELDAYMADS